MSIRAVTIFAFMMMTMFSSMDVRACDGPPPGEMAGVDNVPPINMGVSDSTSDKYCNDCPDMDPGEFCDDCAMTCMSYSSVLQASVLSLSTNEPPGSKINLSLSTQILTPYKFKVLRPPIS